MSIGAWNLSGNAGTNSCVFPACPYVTQRLIVPGLLQAVHVACKMLIPILYRCHAGSKVLIEFPSTVLTLLSPVFLQRWAGLG